MMKIGRSHILTFLPLFLWLLSASLASALEVPPLSGRVNDLAGMLSATTVQQLESQLAALEAEDSTQIAVLTITSLEGESLEGFSLRVAETWRLGQENSDNGALLLIAQNDRKLRIEVGYGLEGRLTDLASSRIIRNVITPHFKQGDFDRGISAGVAAMIGTVKGEYSAEEIKNTSNSGSSADGFIPYAFFMLFILGNIFKKFRVLAGTVGAILLPLLAWVVFSASLAIIAALIPVGFIAGYLASLLAASTRSSSGGRRHSGWSSSSGSSWSGGGGFSGGGGGFGGGGSSGGW